MKNEPHRDLTRKRILRFAAQLLSAHGLDGVTTRMISQKAKCNLASINYHFGTKEKLYYACIEEVIPETISEFEKIFELVEDKIEFDK